MSDLKVGVRVRALAAEDGYEGYDSPEGKEGLVVNQNTDPVSITNGLVWQVQWDDDAVYVSGGNRYYPDHMRESELQVLYTKVIDEEDIRERYEYGATKQREASAKGDSTGVIFYSGQLSVLGRFLDENSLDID